ncbi:MAG: metallophosphoesterase [Actinomycetota bacterium]|nr:metallophosphoesterase [Actinomycetota bacterium]MDI7252663.1 metallophosphoesterase [Actinomycetota bacterium]
MAVKLVADLHGRYSDLRDEVKDEDVLLVLGDILDLVDWADLSGILPEVVGRDRLVEKLLATMKKGPEAAIELREEIISPHGKYYHAILERAWEQYGEFAAALRRTGCRAYVIYGNGDLPELLAEALRGVENALLAEGRVEIGGSVFGFVPGAVYSPFRMPAEMEDREFGARLEELGAVEVLCTHIPPRVEEALFDVVAGRPVEGSATLLHYLEENAPAYLYHGHVHQPAQRELRIGETRVINVAYYKREGYVHLHR